MNVIIPEIPEATSNIHISTDYRLQKMNDRLNSFFELKKIPPQRASRLILLPILFPLRSQESDDRVRVLTPHAEHLAKNGYVTMAIGSVGKGLAHNTSDAEVFVYQLGTRSLNNEDSIVEGFSGSLHAEGMVVDGLYHPEVGVADSDISSVINVQAVLNLKSDKDNFIRNFNGIFSYPIAGDYQSLVRTVLREIYGRGFDDYQLFKPLIEQVIEVQCHRSSKLLGTLLKQAKDKNMTMPWSKLEEMETAYKELKRNPPTFNEIVAIYDLEKEFSEGKPYTGPSPEDEKLLRRAYENLPQWD